MAKKSTLLDDVLSRASASKPGFLSWFERLPPEAQAELEAVRQSFNPKAHQKKAYCRAIIEAATERGWETSGIQGVLSWLNNAKR